LIIFFLKKNIKIELITANKKNIFLKHKNLSFFCLKKPNKEISNFSKILQCSVILNKRLKKNNPKNTNLLSLQNSVLSILISKINNYKITIKNANPIVGLFLSGNRIINLLVFLLKISLYNFANTIIVNSEYNKKTLSKFILNKKKIIKIYNPIKLEKKIIKTRREKIILYVGRIVKEKGLITLIKAFKLISDKEYKLLIVGDGNYKKKIISLIKKEKLADKVKITGWVKNTQRYYLKSNTGFANFI